MQALVRTLWMSGAYAGVENLVAIIYIFGAHVPLFVYGCGPAALLHFWWLCAGSSIKLRCI